MIDISVIVPVFNSSDVIEECLRAVRDQKGIDPATCEIIVVDDASTDSSASKAKNFCDRLIVFSRNSGAAKARNTGAEAAAGGTLVFVDSDVILEPDALALLMSVFKKDERVAAVVGRYTERPADKKFINVYHNAFTRYHHDLPQEEIDWFWGALGAVKKEIFKEAGGFDERYQGASGEDLALGKILSDRGKRILYVPDAQGIHARQFTFAGMVKNDYQKAVTGMKMRLSGHMPQRAPGFINTRSLTTAILLILCPFLILLNVLIHVPFLIEICVLILFALMMINRPFYACLSETLENKYRILIPFVHWLQMYAILTGALMGTAGYAFGRTAFGRPGWI